MYSIIRSLVWALSFQFVLVEGKDKHKTLNEPFQSSFHNLQHSPCVTLYNRAGRVGCGTVDREVQSGPIYYYDGSNGVPNDGQNFVAVIEEYQMTAEVINKLVSANSNGNLKGIMVLNGTDTDVSNSEYASPGPIYPLGYGTPSEGISYGDNDFAWNANGDGLIHSDLYGVPMVYINEYETSYYIRNAAQDENKASVIYSEFNYYMGPDGITSKDCLKWVDSENQEWSPKCLPLGGVSVWGYAGSPPKPANDDNNNNNNDDANSNSANTVKSAVVVGTSIDSTSMFHDLVPGSNEGASNVLATIMAAYLIGKSVDDATLDQLPNRIVFGLFEGEAYGYLGSRRFVNDVLNFQCNDQYKVRSMAKDENSDMACLYPMRPSLKFKDIGDIAAMLTVDQVGLPSGDGNLFVHNSGQTDMGSFLANVMMSSGTSYYKAAASAAENGNDGYPYPPTPLSSLLSVTGGGVDGAVLTGYDYVFTKRPSYQSHMQGTKMNLKAVASAATILARTALAAAYDDGSYDSDTASSYATNAISELSYDDDLLIDLADCLFVNGNCKLLNKYASMEAANDRDKTGFDIGSGTALGQPPNYYVSIYHFNNGQPFVKVGSKVYGSYDGDDYGKSSGDSIGMQPKMLQQALRNMLHTFLGQGSSMVAEDGSQVTPKSCSSAAKCKDISYCSSDADSATCSADNVCVCQRGFYHIALDEAVDPTPNKSTGFFDISSDDAGVSALWTEPFWSSSVGVNMYRYTDSNAGWFVLASGAIFSGLCFFLVVLLKVGMKKEKLY
jgi:nicastrin